MAFGGERGLSLEVQRIDKPGRYLQHCPRRERRVLGHLPEPAQHAEVASLLQRNELVAATDGSFDRHQRRAAGSWILSTRSGKKKFKGTCTVDGERESLDSYRAELEAIRSLAYYIRFLRRVISTFTKEVHLKIWIDNLQALRNGTQGVKCTPKNTLMPEYDIIADIAGVCAEGHIRFLGEHIKSHQEDASGVVPLEVNLNDECDILAKRHVSMASGEEYTKHLP